MRKKLLEVMAGLRDCFARERAAVCFEEGKARALIAKGRQIESVTPVSKRRIPACVVLPKNAVIERRLECEAGKPNSDRHITEDLFGSLPFSLEDVGYGTELQVCGNKIRGVLLAAPEATVEGLVSETEKLGYCVREVVSYQHAVAELIPSKQGFQCLFVLEGKELSAVATENGHVLGAKFVSLADPEWRDEISFFLMEKDVRKPRVYCYESEKDGFSRGLQAYLLERFGSAPESVNLPRNVSPVLCGALLKSGSAINLLSSRRKTAMLAEQTTGELHAIGKLASICICIVFMSLCLTQIRRARHEEWVQSEIRRLKPSVEEVLQRVESAEKFASDRAQSFFLLDTLKAISEKLPGEVVIESLAWGPEGLRLRGISPEYAGVNSTVTLLSDLPGFESAALEYARLQKRESRDFFLFEASVPFEAEARRRTGLLPGLSPEEMLSSYQWISGHRGELLRQYGGAETPHRRIPAEGREWLASFESQVFKLTSCEPAREGYGAQPIVRAVFEGEMREFLGFVYETARSGVFILRELAIEPKPGVSSGLKYRLTVVRSA